MNMDREIEYRINGLKCVIEYEINRDGELVDWQIVQIGNRDVGFNIVQRFGSKYRVRKSCAWLEKKMDMDDFAEACFADNQDDGSDRYYDQMREAG